MCEDLRKVTKDSSGRRPSDGVIGAEDVSVTGAGVLGLRKGEFKTSWRSRNID